MGVVELQSQGYFVCCLGRQHSSRSGGQKGKAATPANQIAHVLGRDPTQAFCRASAL